MSTKYNDAWVWLGLGVFSAVALRTAVYQLHQIRIATESHLSTKETSKLSQTTEDALEIDTLRKLAVLPNPELRDATVRIIYERVAANPAAIDQLLRQVTDPNHTRRAIALRGLGYMSLYVEDTQFATLPVFTALTTALTYTLNDPHRSSSYTQRSITERLAISLFSRLQPLNPSAALQSGIVTRWLAHYPFLDAGPDPASRIAAVKALSIWNGNDVCLSNIIYILHNHADGRKAMRQAGLIGSEVEEADEEDDHDVHMRGTSPADPASAAAVAMGWDILPSTHDVTGPPASPVHPRGRRVREESVEEQMVRRRRREAMVVSDGGLAPTSTGDGSGDVIDSEEDWDPRREVERVMEALAEEMGRQEARIA
ncbi:MAG: hypothetical protein M1817_005029 [Caeruleum heppii]|nr:MAG: hypothetical protein M1817_005029 [Caeruleum heppii]